MLAQISQSLDLSSPNLFTLIPPPFNHIHPTPRLALAPKLLATLPKMATMVLTNTLLRQDKDKLLAMLVTTTTLFNLAIIMLKNTHIMLDTVQTTVMLTTPYNMATMMLLDMLLATILPTTLFNMANMMLTTTQPTLGKGLDTVSSQASKVYTILFSTVSTHQLLSEIATV